MASPDTDTAISKPVRADAPDDLQGLLPVGTRLLESQVSGHSMDLQNNKIGILQGLNGHVLKPIMKPNLGEREIAFYENLRHSGHPIDIELQRYVPFYYGSKEYVLSDNRVKFLELEDITDGMAEPCVMDVKIGRRTWDPLASHEKRAGEDLKYAESKKAYGFCIPGFQVYRVPAGDLHKYDKEYGKKLNKASVVEALELFLNGTPSRPPCRELVVRLLSILWKISALFREQRRYRLYSSSLLIAYDAKRLRHHLRRQLNNSFAESLLRAPVVRSRTFSAARSLGSLNNLNRLAATSSTAPTSPTSPTPPTTSALGKTFSILPRSRPGSPKLDYSAKPAALSPSRPGSPKLDSPTRSPRINRTIDRLQRLKRSISLQNCDSIPDKTVIEFKQSFSMDSQGLGKKWPDLTVQKLCRTHSYSNNFDADIIQMKEDYAALLSELSSSCEEKQNWVRVYLIDFAHVFPSQDGELDHNYLEGIENLIKILEKFLN